ncbi:MAG: hypothetical protein HDT07_05485 [Bacteroidales bacterium]|nr:hypothetical protein [Bacteroidales bacterium]
MKLRPLLFAVCLLTAARAVCFNVADSLKTRFENRPLLPVEGIWQWNDRAVIMIEGDETGRLDITLLHSPDPSVETPLAIGNGYPGGKARQFIIEMDKDFKPKRLPTKKRARFIATIDSDRRLILTPYSTGINIKLSLWRALPYLGRISASREKQPDGLIGAWRLYPRTPDPINPIVL